MFSIQSLPLVACFDEQLHVCGHEGCGHADVRPVRQHKLGVVAQLLDEGKDVVPTTTVQACKQAIAFTVLQNSPILLK
jgi:hypothetical protein